MKLAFDHKKIHLRFIFGTGFILFVLRKVLGKNDREAAQELKPICREIKKLLKEYKKANGSLTLVDISGTDEDGKSKICIKL